MSADAAHPIVAGLGEAWPALLGYNRVTAKPGRDAGGLASATIR